VHQEVSLRGVFRAVGERPGRRFRFDDQHRGAVRQSLHRGAAGFSKPCFDQVDLPAGVADIDGSVQIRQQGGARWKAERCDLVPRRFVPGGE